ncbi:MAG: hypothetical protein JXR70_06950 [Spirochaetales bacterium]|nr:hypothetical protein [Spirochaetales bacterium]
MFSIVTNRLKIIFPFLFIFVCLVSCPPPEVIPPSVTWYSPGISRTLGNGSLNLPVEIRFSSSVDIDNIQLRLSPEIETFVILPPVLPTSLKAGQEYSVLVHFRIPGKAVEGRYQGSLYCVNPQTAIDGKYEIDLSVDYADIQLTDKVKFLPESAWKFVLIAGPDYIDLKYNTLPSGIETFQVDDILVCPGTAIIPSGFSGKIESIDTTNGFVFRLKAAPLEQIIKQAKIDVVNTFSQPGYVNSKIDIGHKVCYPKEYVLFDADKNKDTTGDQVRLLTKQCYTLGFRFTLDFNGSFLEGDLNHMSFSVYGKTDGEIEIEAVAEWELFKVEQELDLDLPGIPLPIVVGGVPLNFQITPSLYIGAEGTVFAGLNLGASYEMTVETGIDYTKDDADGEDWTPFFNFNPEYEPFKLRPSIGVDVEAYIKLKFNTQYMLIPDVGIDCGPTFSLKCFYEFEADIFDDPWWELWRGCSATWGFEAGIDGWARLEWEQPHPKVVKVRILDSGGPYGGEEPTPTPEETAEPTEESTPTPEETPENTPEVTLTPTPYSSPEPGLVDLQATRILYNEDDIIPGGEVLFNSGVLNNSDVESGRFNIAWYVDGQRLGYGNHRSVPARSIDTEGNSDFTWTVLKGAHSISFVVDEDNEIDENDETNNSVSVDISLLADLEPLAITYAGDIPEPGETLRLESAIANNGTVDSSAFNIAWYVDDVQLGYGSHEAVPAGETDSTGNSFFDYTVEEGEHEIRFVVDSDDEVEESDESNNQVSIVIGSNQTGPCDLEPLAITYEEYEINGIKTIVFDSGVRNNGPGNSEGFYVAWYIDDTQVSFGPHTAVPANSVIISDNSGFIWEEAQPGSHEIRFVVDSEGQLEESNEDNNSMTLVIDVQ